MFSLIESKEEIAKAQHRLEAAICRDFKTKAVKNIGYPGGTTFDAKVFTNGSYLDDSSDYYGKNIPESA